jgi:hypothetical protein
MNLTINKVLFVYLKYQEKAPAVPSSKEATEVLRTLYNEDVVEFPIKQEGESDDEFQVKKGKAIAS